MTLSFANPPSKQIAPHKLAHVVLKTRDIKRMVAFYTEFLGGTALCPDDSLAFVQYDDEHHRIAFVQIPGLREKDPGTAGLHHIAFTFPSLRHLLLAYRQRKAKGIMPAWCVNHGPTVSMYYLDPEGNTLETQHDVFETIEAANAMMHSEAFAKNPIGVDFDPEEMIERLEKGESQESIAVRGDIGPRGIEGIPEAIRAA
ncbi:Glyoxalase/Bleomycin resistance protein/Dihydroxybiphenyl dioxygenase [Lophiostoma macrostomum CBS 122681]|uniref:Glyoxalase/Bleomycin resistance protein/Dihydroxybiphenyl dioxygenase n=1 Tax=Lophiostoma macrostomum CBS 122681 TaxID=1314788 RepID=A0A6A6TQI0_9PLEO|nr:Glyoxalase/Bleomycin resistance protein/Dihydroxybiphenyl dioxygenase [Lophiostoma macrostomum CBS 122681]